MHDLHVSICEMRWNEESSSFEVSIKIFIDDLELALSKDGISGLSIGTSTEVTNANDYVLGYLQNHFKIEMDGYPLDPVFLGKEISEDFQAVWCYVEFPAKNGHAKKMTLSNDLFLELYEDQRNIMDIRMSKSHKDFTIFQSGHTTWSYTF